MTYDDRKGVLIEQLEIGVPLTQAMLLAGIDFDEMEAVESDPDVQRLVQLCEAKLMSKHLERIVLDSENNVQSSKWILEKKFPSMFGPATRRVDEPHDLPSVIEFVGVKSESEPQEVDDRDR